MIKHYLIYLSIVGLAVISLTVFYFMLGKSGKKLPETWKNSFPSSNFRISILFLLIYLLLIFFGELISIYIATHGIYNSFVMSINKTLYTPFLFGFLFMNTHTSWKRYVYIGLYLIVVGHLLYGNYYHPRSIILGTTIIVFFSTDFLAVLVQLTDLLENPKSDHFKFQLKVNLSILISSLLATILSSFHYLDTEPNTIQSEIFFYTHFYNLVLFYFSLGCIFLTEILKLRRR